MDFPVEMELVIVDDGSTNGAPGAVFQLGRRSSGARTLLKETNGGKGSAIKKGAELADGDYIIMCDADLEYSPEEIPGLLKPILAGAASVVYGTRTFGSHNSYSYLYVLGNRGVTTVANILNCYLSDLETCFKLMPLELYRFVEHHLERLRHGSRNHRQAAERWSPALRNPDHLRARTVKPARSSPGKMAWKPSSFSRK